MGPIINSRIETLDVKIPLLWTEYAIWVAKHNSSVE